MPRHSLEGFRFFLVGPVAGIPLQNGPAFIAAAQEIRLRGGEAVAVVAIAAACGIDPQAVDSLCHALAGEEGEAVIAASVLELAESDAVVTLPGWDECPLARVEVALAEVWEVPVVDLATIVGAFPETSLSPADAIF